MPIFRSPAPRLAATKAPIRGRTPLRPGRRFPGLPSKATQPLGGYPKAEFTFPGQDEAEEVVFPKLIQGGRSDGVGQIHRVALGSFPAFKSVEIRLVSLLQTRL